MREWRAPRLSGTSRVMGVIVILLLVLLGWLQYRLWVGHGGAAEVQSLPRSVYRVHPPGPGRGRARAFD